MKVCDVILIYVQINAFTYNVRSILSYSVNNCSLTAYHVLVIQLGKAADDNAHGAKHRLF